MLENIPGTVCMSEPDVTTNICLMAKANQMDESEISSLTQSAIRLLCKESSNLQYNTSSTVTKTTNVDNNNHNHHINCHQQNGQQSLNNNNNNNNNGINNISNRNGVSDCKYLQRFVIKTRYNCSTEIAYVMKHFPTFRQLYLYRNLGQVIPSYYKFLHRDLGIDILESVFNSLFVKLFLPGIRTNWFHFIAGDENQKTLKKVCDVYSFMGFATACIASSIVEFQNALKDGSIDSTIPTLHYDELMRAPSHVSRRLFDVMGLPKEHVDSALSAMDRDSQKGTILSNISNRYNKAMTSRDVTDCNVVLSLLGLPDMTQSLSLPNPIHAMQEETN